MFASKKNGAEEEVDSLIDSMLRLIDYMNQNQPFKKDIFMSFTIEDLQKILHNMEDSNLKLRKVSCLFLCSILSSNENQEKFCNFMDLLPVNSKLALNSVPQKLQKIFTANPSLLSNINLSSTPQDSPFCWYYSYQMAQEKLESPKWILNKQIKDVKKYFNSFVDPQDCLIGIVVNLPLNKLKKLTPDISANLRKSADTFQTFFERQQCFSITNQIVQAPKKEIIIKQLQNFISQQSQIERKSKSPEIEKENKSKQVSSRLRKQENNSPANAYNQFLNSTRTKTYSNNQMTNGRNKSNKSDKKYDLFKPRYSDNIFSINSCKKKQKYFSLESPQQSQLQNRMKTSANIEAQKQVQNIYYQKNVYFLNKHNNLNQVKNGALTPTDRQFQSDRQGQNNVCKKINQIFVQVNNNYGLNFEQKLKKNMIQPQTFKFNHS